MCWPRNVYGITADTANVRRGVQTYSLPLIVLVVRVRVYRAYIVDAVREKIPNTKNTKCKSEERCISSNGSSHMPQINSTQLTVYHLHM